MKLSKKTIELMHKVNDGVNALAKKRGVPESEVWDELEAAVRKDAGLPPAPTPAKSRRRKRRK